MSAPDRTDAGDLARDLERGIPSGPADIHFCPWPDCHDLWESEASCVHAEALELVRRAARTDALREAARDAQALSVRHAGVVGHMDARAAAIWDAAEWLSDRADREARP